MKKLLYSLLTLMPITLACLPSQAQVKITAGTHLVNNGSINLQNINLVNDGSFSNPLATSTLWLSGGTNQSVSGVGTFSLYNITTNKSGGAKTLIQRDLTVPGNITMTAGLIDLTTTTMTLQPTALINNESENSRITASGIGELVITVPVNNQINFNPGNIGISISTQSNLGNTTFRRGHTAQVMSGNNQSINRYFSIEPANNTGINAFIRFNYFDAELNNVVENNAKLHQKAGAGNWTAMQESGVSNVLNWREASGITSLQRYTMFSPVQAPLPLKLLAFTVSCKDGNANLQWATANEINTHQFIIEQSADGTAWTSTSTVPASGNATQSVYSSLVVPNGAVYYRLKMQDQDGSFTYSPVQKMNCDSKDVITVGPNPTTGPLNISFQLAKKDNGTIQVLDTKGHLLQNRVFTAAQGLSVETINLSMYPSGIYFIRINSVNGIKESKQIMKQ